MNEESKLLISKNIIYKESKDTTSSITKLILNINSTWGPAIICLPFIMQRSGVIPTILTFILLNILSIFSSMCLNESYSILRSSKRSNFDKKFDLVKFIQLLIKNEFFSKLSIYSVFSCHFIYSILSIATLTQILDPMLYSIKTPLFDSLNLKSDVWVLFSIFLSFIIFTLMSRFISQILNYFLLITTLVFFSLMIYCNIISNQFFNIQRLSLLGDDYKYLFCTILFTFSYSIVTPLWFQNNQNGDEKSIINNASYFTLCFKIVFTITFANLLKASSIFNFSSYINDSYNFYLKVGLIVFLVASFINNIVIHTNLLVRYFKEYFNLREEFGYLISIVFPWSVTLIFVKASSFVLIINWSSFFIFGFVNFVLPITIYIYSLDESMTFESNYLESAKIQFEEFVYLREQEISMSELESKRQVEIFGFICDIKKKLKEKEEVPENIQEKIIELFYEFDGFYSTKRSFSAITGGIFNFNSNQIKIFFCYIMVVFVIAMFISLYLALYYYFINKTLVVNIFLQTSMN